MPNKKKADSSGGSKGKDGGKDKSGAAGGQEAKLKAASSISARHILVWASGRLLAAELTAAIVWEAREEGRGAGEAPRGRQVRRGGARVLGRQGEARWAPAPAGRGAGLQSALTSCRRQSGMEDTGQPGRGIREGRLRTGPFSDETGGPLVLTGSQEPSTTASPKIAEVRTGHGYHIIMVEGRK